MAPFATLPPEVVDTVIDYAHADLILLKTCSLVCKSWLPAARHHLFSRPIRLTVDNVASFIPLTKGKPSTMSSYVQHIEAEDCYEDDQWIDNFFTNLTSFLSVTSISFAASYKAPLPHSTLSALPCFGKLVKLSLVYCVFEKFSDLQQLICSFPCLEYLYLEADWPQPKTIVQTERSPSTRLRELHLHCSKISCVLEWFLAQPYTSPVTTLTLYGFRIPELPVVGQYLKALGPSLMDLKIIFFRSITEAVAKHIDLSFNTSLRRLEFNTACIKNGGTGNLQMALVLVSRIYSLMLEEVEIYFGSFTRGLQVDSGWADLDAILSSHRYQRMRRIIFSATMIGTTLADCLPLCDKRGILQDRRW